PAWAIGREATAEITLAGRRYPRGAWFWITPYSLHRTPRWFPDPREFKPERWENGFAKKLPKYAYLPFGGGPRVCIGNQFAMMEARLILATVVQRCQLSLEPGQEILPMQLVTVRPRHGIRMRMAVREQANR